LRILLKRQFDEVATGEYSWIKELDDAGYSCREIADILFQDANDSPWIYFEPRKFDPPVYPRGKVHVQGCVHCCFEDQTMSKEPHPSPHPGGETEAEEVQELCGLAGITPTSRDPKEWNGEVKFKDQNSVAIISYAVLKGNGHLDHLLVLHRIITSLERFCTAAGRVQAFGLCCESLFTPNPTLKEE
jgi:hypothetical protein